MKKRTALLQFLLSVIPALAAGSLGAYLYCQEGTPGLLRWMPEYSRLFILLLAAGLVPSAIFLLSLFLRHGGNRVLSVSAAVLAAVLSVPVTAGCAVGLAYLHGLIHAVPRDLPALNRYDPVKGTPLVRLAFSSDPHIGNPASAGETTKTLLETVNSGGYDAFFVLGDIADMGVPGTGFETAAALFSETLTKVPLVTLMGNHDALIGGEYRYRRIFNQELYFRIDSGNAHVIAVNLLWGSERFGREQKAWLEKTLESIPESDTTIVISHAFIRASGYRDSGTGLDWFDNKGLIDELAPILENGGVDLVVSGHNHFMEYLEHGTAYALIGSMGGKSDPERTYVSEWSRWYCGDQPGFLDVDLYDGRMKLTFRDETGKQLYAVTK